MNNCTVYSELQPDLTNRPATKCIFGIFYTFAIFFGVAGNGAIVYTTCRLRSIQSVQNILIFNLSIANLLICLTSGPLTPVQIIYKEWFFGAAMCHLIPWAQGTSIVVSAFTLAMIALDRFTLVAFPHQPHLTNCVTWRLVIPSLWFFAGALILPYGYFMKIERYDGLCGQFCDEGWPNNSHLKKAFSFWILILQFAIPFFIIVICYAGVYYKLRAHIGQKLARLSKQASDEGDIAKRQQITRQRLRSTGILIAMVAVFFVSYLPQNTFTLYIEHNERFYHENEGTVYFMHLIGHALTMISVLANPILYVFLNPNLRQTLLKTSQHGREPCESYVLLKSQATPSQSQNVTHRLTKLEATTIA